MVCVNKKVSYRTEAEKRNKCGSNVRNQNKKIKTTCECGSTFRQNDKSNHVKTIKHQNYLNSLEKIADDKNICIPVEQTRNISPFQKFIIYIVEHNQLMPNKSAKELLELFKKYCEDELLISDDKTNSTNFGRWMNEIEGIKRIKGRMCYSYEFNVPLMHEYLIKKNLILL